MANRGLNTIGARQIARYLGRTLEVTSAKLVGHVGVGGRALRGHLTMEHLHMTDSHFEDVSFLQLVVVPSTILGLVVIQDEVFELVE